MTADTSGRESPESASTSDRHAEIKRRVIAIDGVIMASTLSDGTLAVCHDSNEEPSEVQTLMDLAGYSRVNRSSVDSPPVVADDVETNLWDSGGD